MSAIMRQIVERKIVGRFVRDALKASNRLSVSLDRGYDVDEMLIASTDRRKIMAEAFAGDDAHIFVHPPHGKPVVGGQVNSRGWVYLVFGNDGWDVINDYTMNLEPLMAGANELSQRYQ